MRSQWRKNIGTFNFAISVFSEPQYDFEAALDFPVEFKSNCFFLSTLWSGPVFFSRLICVLPDYTS